jgi:hypothetical protein
MKADERRFSDDLRIRLLSYFVDIALADAEVAAGGQGQGPQRVTAESRWVKR